jgi:hypothetical protein
MLDDLRYIDSYDYNFTIITKIDEFKDYVETTYINETSLRFELITLEANENKIIC